MREPNPNDEVARLQQHLRNAKEAGDVGAEIDALLAIGETTLQGAPDLAFSHFKLAEKVIRGGRKLERLHEAIGGQGKALRRRKRFAEAIDRYRAAEGAASGADNKAAQVRWLLKRASTHRSQGDLKESKAAVEQAENLLRPPPTEEVSFAQIIGRVNFFEKGEIAALAELEGQMGLNLVEEQDEQGASDHYSSALYFAEMAEDWDAMNTWGTNVGNAFRRRGRYGKAVECYEKALVAAMKVGDGNALLNTAKGLAVCLSQAYRHEEGGDRLCALANDVEALRLKVGLLDHALTLFDEGLCAEKAIETATKIEALLADQPVVPEFLSQVKSVREKMEDFVGKPSAPSEGPPVLDVYLPEYMMRAEKSGEAGYALKAAHLVCDVRLALAMAGQKHWKRTVGGDMLAYAGLDHRVVFETLSKLLEANRTDDALELLQRLKAPTFCVPTLLRLESAGASSAEARAYLKAVRDLCDKVEALASPIRNDFIRDVNAVRRAAERIREAGEDLREVDPLLLARMGGLVRREELIDALPFAGGVGIVDFMVGRDSTAGVVLSRDTEGVTATPFIAPTFNATHAIQLAKLYAEGNLPKQLGGAHTKALMQISKILHDNLFCRLARALSERGINQLILVPDLTTRNLPLHLAYACGKEFDIPGVDTKDADYLCEVMPVEYAPCLQAVAASQVYLRPRAISRIAAFADPTGDLPGVRASMEEFGTRSEDPSVFNLKVGASATKAAVVEALQEADVMMFGTHGLFSPGDLERTQLVLSGDPWTMADMLGMPELQKRALLVLVACEAGAIAATPDDRNAWGIPGALVSAGASAVLANLWPVEDITSNYLLERFLFHLGHRGYRPAAALFRAVRELRRMARDAAVEYSRNHLELMTKNKAQPRVLIGTRTILEWIEDNDFEQPFEHPYFWGATVIFGSGWHLPAGAVVGPPHVMIENVLRQAEADGLVMRKPREALELSKQVANSSDGVSRGRAYTTMALAMLRSADISSQRSARQKASRLLKMAQRLAVNEADDDLRDRVQWVQTEMEVDDVVKKND
jgi:CHAT domain-containing protein/tetratricopeptide (TPR) repeat protein